MSGTSTLSTKTPYKKVLGIIAKTSSRETPYKSKSYVLLLAVQTVGHDREEITHCNTMLVTHYFILCLTCICDVFRQNVVLVFFFVTLKDRFVNTKNSIQHHFLRISLFAAHLLAPSKIVVFMAKPTSIRKNTSATGSHENKPFMVTYGCILSLP